MEKSMQLSIGLSLAGSPPGIRRDRGGAIEGLRLLIKPKLSGVNQLVPG